MMLKYKMEQFILNIIDRLTFKRCKECDEITFDGLCGYCCDR